MKKNLIIVFLKNPIKGKVKTRLANDIGENRALQVYNELLKITKAQIDQVDFADVHIYYSESGDEFKWEEYQIYIQKSGDLGVRMQNAFKSGFDKGYQSIVGIGSDLPDITTELLKQAFQYLRQVDTVFGPAADGGYYLLGMNRLIPTIFINKSWSTESLYQETRCELIEQGITIGELVILNDIDTLEDLQNSSLSAMLNNTYSE